jgi:hypothetical protein
MLKILRACYPRYIYVLESKIFLPSCLRSGRAPVQTPNFLRAGRVIPCHAVCGGARAHVGVPKMPSHDCPCAFFVRVVHPWKPQISFGRFGSARPGRVGSCRAVCGCPGTRGRAKNSKSSPPVCLLHIRAARFPDAPSGLRSGRAPMETPNFVRACTHGNPKFRSGGSGRVVCGCPCKRVRASRVGSGRAVPRVGAREHVAVQKMLGRDHPCASCTFARPVCLTLRRAFVRAGRVVPCVGARAHVAVPKMLSHDPPCAFYTFVRPVCPTLPCAFVRVAHPWKPQISFGLCI